MKNLVVSSSPHITARTDTQRIMKRRYGGLL